MLCVMAAIISLRCFWKKIWHFDLWSFFPNLGWSFIERGLQIKTLLILANGTRFFSFSLARLWRFQMFCCGLFAVRLLLLFGVVCADHLPPYFSILPGVYWINVTKIFPDFFLSFLRNGIHSDSVLDSYEEQEFWID